jgi:hypothetical protein
MTFIFLLVAMYFSMISDFSGELPAGRPHFRHIDELILYFHRKLEHFVNRCDFCVWSRGASMNAAPGI